MTYEENRIKLEKEGAEVYMPELMGFAKYAR